MSDFGAVILFLYTLHCFYRNHTKYHMNLFSVSALALKDYDDLKDKYQQEKALKQEAESVASKVSQLHL